MQGIAEVLSDARKKGVVLWSEGGQLRFSGPKGALTAEEIQKLRAARSQIIALLEGTSAGPECEFPLRPRQKTGPAPLTHSQQAHWKLWRLGERPSIRQVAHAVELSGRLDLGALQRSVDYLVERHEALRTRVELRGGAPVQVVDSHIRSEVELVRLASTSFDGREEELSRSIDEFIYRPVDVGVGSLFAVKLIELCDDEHVLVLATEHLISDGHSLTILLKELFAAYELAVSGRPIRLPGVEIQFADYAEWQKGSHKHWLERHGPYWEERLEGVRHLRAPRSFGAAPRGERAWGAVPVRIDGDTRKRLQCWCREQRTTLVMASFAAYAAMMLRWCSASEAVFRFVSDGREDLRTEHTVGFFATVLYLRVGLHPGDRFSDFVQRVTAEYCAAHEHADHSFLAAGDPAPEYAANPVFNWAPQGALLPQLTSLEKTAHALKLAPVPIVIPLGPDPEIEREPSILLFDREEGIVGDFYFPSRRIAERDALRFGAGIAAFLQELLRDPHRPLASFSVWKLQGSVE